MSKGFLKFSLAERVNEALVKIGYKKPTTVQDEVIPLILSKRNVIVEAATGTGKTAAYGLPLLSRIDLLKRSTQVLVLVPSRELALQVETALRTFTTHEKFRVASVYGGMSLAESEKKIKSSPHILVAVPGRLKDVLRVGKLDHLWRDIKYLVIDEADKLLEAGFQETLDNLVSHLRNMVQVALFSATISEDAEALIRERFAPLQVVRLSPAEALKNIYFHYVVVDQGQKQRYLAAIILQQKIKQGLIFTPSRDEVHSVANFLRGMGLKAEAYHGLLDQVERTAVMKRFKNKQVNFLVATDLAARGLDVETLPAVINYAFPDELEIYLHRCGRTGRAGRRGAVYNLVGSKKEEVLVESFHVELAMPVKGFEVVPLTKEAVAHVEDKLVKVHLNRGKRDKLSAGDIVGSLVNETGLNADKIGTIAIYDAYTLVDLPEWALDLLIEQAELKLKGKVARATKYGLDDQKRKSEALKKSQIGVRDRKEMAEREARIAAGKPAKRAAVKAVVDEEHLKPRKGAAMPSSDKAGAAGKKLKAKGGEEAPSAPVIKAKPRPSAKDKKAVERGGKSGANAGGKPSAKSAGKSGAKAQSGRKDKATGRDDAAAKAASRAGQLQAHRPKRSRK